MSNPSPSVLDLLADALERSEKRDWSRSREVGSMSREEAVAAVGEVLREQTISEPQKSTPGFTMLEGSLHIDKYFGSLTPSEEQIESVIAQVKNDYHAFQAVSFLYQVSESTESPALKRWHHQRYLGIVKQPSAPPGQSATKKAHRDSLLVNQIKQLVAVGFAPMRSSASEHHECGCDIVRDALSRMGIHMSYDALEAIWKKRHEALSAHALAELLTEGLKGMTPKGF